MTQTWKKQGPAPNAESNVGVLGLGSCCGVPGGRTLETFWMNPTDVTGMAWPRISWMNQAKKCARFFGVEHPGWTQPVYPRWTCPGHLEWTWKKNTFSLCPGALWMNHLGSLWVHRAGTSWMWSQCSCLVHCDQRVGHTLVTPLEHRECPDPVLRKETMGKLWMKLQCI